MDKIFVIKIGGNVIDDEEKLSVFLQHFAAVDGAKILVHGGGKLATNLAEQLQIPQKMIEGRRVTDEDSLRIVTMVYAGYINKNIVARLQGLGCNATGLSGADGNLIQAHKRVSGDYGFVGDIDLVNKQWIESLLAADKAIVIAPITHDKKGQLLNTNADTIAQKVASAMAGTYKVHLIYSFEKEGVLLDADDDASVISNLDKKNYDNLKKSGTIYAGMIPKLDNAFDALDSGISKVVIGRAEKLDELISGKGGTTISNE
jgi:acetylglutamate kinase